MTPQKKDKQPRRHPSSEVTKTVTRISSTEWVTSYSDGYVVRSRQNRPDNASDIKWMFGMIHDLATPLSEKPVSNETETAA
jgi:hypothetical protein